MISGTFNIGMDVKRSVAGWHVTRAETECAAARPPPGVLSLNAPDDGAVLLD